MDLLITTAILWAILFACTALFPYRLFNSVTLSIALISTAFMILYFFTRDVGIAMMIEFLAIGAALLLVPFLLIFNGIIMIRKEGRSLANLLSLLLGIGIEIGELALIVNVIFNYSMGIDFFKKIDALLLFTGMTVFYFSFLILLFVLYMIYFQWVPHRYDFEYIIIHGCGLLQGYKVSRLLSNRIDKGISVFHKGNEKAMIICSGGQGSDEDLSEAAAMAGYLKEKGVPENHILLEDKSTTTEENLKFSYEIIKARGGAKRIAVVSSNYHVFRCVLLAHKMKIPAVGLGAATAFYYWPSAVIREFVAVYADKKRILWTLLGYLLFISPFLYLLFNS